jgi:hypothetical protein
VFGLMVEDHTDRARAEVGGESLVHDSILSRIGVSGNPGAIHNHTSP